MARLLAWRSYDREKKKKRRLRFLSGGFLLLVFLVTASFLFFRTKTFFRESRIGGNSRVSIAVDSEPVLLLSLSLDRETLTVASIPGDVFVETVNGYGNYRLGSVFQLSLSEKRDGSVFLGTVSELLGIPVDGYLAPVGRKWRLEELTLARVRDIKNELLGLSILRHLPLFLGKEIGALQTNLSLFDLAKVYVGLGKVRFDKIDFLDFSKDSVVSPLVLADGSEALAIDAMKVDSLLGDSFFEKEIREENLKIDILNSTSLFGLGGKMARMIGHMGGTVIDVSNVDIKTEKCQVVAPKEMILSRTAKRITSYFGCEEAVGVREGSRADLSIIVGSSYAEFLFGRE